MNYPYPWPVPAVRLIVPNSQGRVLLLQRNTSDYAGGLWCLPGGKIDYGDTVGKTVKKELLEETGLQCLDYQFLLYQDSLPVDARGMHCLNLYFKCAWQGVLQLNEESSNYVWLSETELGQYEIAFKNDLALKAYWSMK
ncbi:MAG TPA: NUDIX domain-containing protein [Bacillota bacterium]|nr:NUDIX domain-containing protein [Bacillota bacterium]